MLQAVARYFFRGLLVLVPVALTAWVVYAVFVTIDGWVNVGLLLGRRIPGAGVVLTFLLITLTGFLAGNIATRWIFHLMDVIFRKLPLVKLLYNSIKDLIGAFVGEQKRFDRPVLVSLGEGVDTEIVGFLTRDDLSDLGLEGRVAVYFPQSYNFAGNLLIVPRRRIRELPAPSAEVMALIVSGGVTGPAQAPRP